MSTHPFNREWLGSQLRLDLAADFPDLRVQYGPTGLAVLGQFPVKHERAVLGVFELAIELPRRFPHSMPLIRETASRIPIRPERHMLDNGALCLFHPTAYWLLGFDQKPLSALLAGPVHKNLLFQLFVEEELDWPYAELEHGLEGELQFFDEAFGTSRTVTMRCLGGISRGLTARSPCPCGSAKATVRCHHACLELATNGARPAVKGLLARTKLQQRATKRRDRVGNGRVSQT